MTPRILDDKKTDEIPPSQENSLKLFEEKRRRIQRAHKQGSLQVVAYLKSKNNYFYKNITM